MKKSLLVVSADAEFLGKMAAAQPQIAPDLKLVTAEGYADATGILASFAFDAIILGLRDPGEHEKMVEQSETLAGLFPKTLITIYNTRSVTCQADVIDLFRSTVLTSMSLRELFGPKSDIVARA